MFALSATALAPEEQATAASSITVLDPYLLTIPSSHTLAVSAVAAASAGTKATAKGIIADGTSAAIRQRTDST